MIKKKKISELPLAQSFVGLFTIGVDNFNKSVKVGLEFLKTAEKAAEIATDAANSAANNANTATSIANNAASNANQAATQTSSVITAANNATSAANSAAGNAETKASAANSAATLANQKASLAELKAVEANSAAALAEQRAEEAAVAATAAALSRDTEIGVWRYVKIPTDNTGHRFATHLQILPNGNIFLVSPTQNYIYDKYYNVIARSAGLYDYTTCNSRLCATDTDYIYFVSQTKIFKLDFNLRVILQVNLPIEAQQQHPFIFNYFGQICLFANKIVYDVNVVDLSLSPKSVVFKGVEYSLSNIIAVAHNEKLNVFSAFGAIRTSDSKPCIITKYGVADNNCAVVSDASYARSVAVINRLSRVEFMSSKWGFYCNAFTSDGYVVLFSLASEQFEKSNEVKQTTDYNPQLSPLPAVYALHIAYDYFNGIVYGPSPYKALGVPIGTVVMNRFGTLIGAKTMLDINGSAIQRLP